MTDNIQKLYEIAGVERVYIEFNNNGEIIVERVFSHYKQLELIKLLATSFSQNCILHIDRWTSGKVRLALDKDKYTEPYYDSDYAYGHKDFSQCLAGLTIELWQDLSVNQKQEIKEILQ